MSRPFVCPSPAEIQEPPFPIYDLGEFDEFDDVDLAVILKELNARNE